MLCTTSFCLRSFPSTVNVSFSINWLKARKVLHLEIGKCLIVATAVCFIKLQTIMIEMVFAVMKSSPYNPLNSRLAFNRIVCRLSSFLCTADSLGRNDLTDSQKAA